MADGLDSVTLNPIGVAHTPFERTEDAPHQGFASDEEAVVEVFEPYADGLADIDTVHHLTVVYWAHLADRDAIDGAFGRRGPDRPNPICLCSCLLLEVANRRLRVRGLDAVDGSPVLDCKPALQAEQ